MPWKWVVVNAPDGSAIGELTAAKAKQCTWPLFDAASASFTIDGLHPQAKMVKELETDLILYDPAGVKRFRGRMGTSTDQLDTTGHLVTFSAVDYRGFLARRILWDTNTLVFTALDQGGIPWTLIDQSQAEPYGDLGIRQGSGAITGVPQTYTFQAGSKISDLINQIATVNNGFDWEIDPSLKLNIYYPARGRTTSQVLEWGSTVIAVRPRVLDTSLFANAIRYTGGTGLLPEAEGSVTIGASGRWESQIGDPTVVDQATVLSKAQVVLAESEVPSPGYVLVLSQKPPKAGGTEPWWNPEVLWLGDTSMVVVKSGRLDVNTTQRISQVQLNVGDDGGDVVTLTTGPVFKSNAKRANDVLRRLDNLERT